MSFVVLGCTLAVFLAISLLCAVGAVLGARSRRARQALLVGSLAFLYYAVSTGMSMTNKWMYGRFKFPLTATAVHVAMKFLMSAVALGLPCLRRGPGPLTSTSRQDMVRLVVPIGVATALDISLTNVAVQSLHLTLVTIGKTSSLPFNYMLSVGLGLQPFLLSLGSTVLCISGGMVLASLHSADFLPWPFMAVLGAGFMAAARWVTTERYLVAHGKRVSSMQLLYMLSPISLPLLIPFAVWLEGRDLIESPVWHNRTDTIISVMGTVGVGLSSFLLILLEMAIVRRTSALTTDVLGYIKNVTLIVLAGVTFDEGLSPVNVLGVVITFTAAIVYSMLMNAQHNRPRQGKSKDAQAAYEILSVLEMSNNWEEGDGDPDEDGSLDGASLRSGVNDSPASNVDSDPVDVNALHKARRGRAGGSRTAGSRAGRRGGANAAREAGAEKAEEDEEEDEGEFSPLFARTQQRPRHAVAPSGPGVAQGLEGSPDPGVGGEGQGEGEDEGGNIRSGRANDSLDLTAGGRTVLGGGPSADDAFLVLDRSAGSPVPLGWDKGSSPSPSLDFLRNP